MDFNVILAITLAILLPFIILILLFGPFYTQDGPEEEEFQWHDGWEDLEDDG